MKRADWKILKNIKLNEKLKLNFASMPLLDLRNCEIKEFNRRSEMISSLLLNAPCDQFVAMVDDDDLILHYHLQGEMLLFEIIANMDNVILNHKLIYTVDDDKVSVEKFYLDKNLKEIINDPIYDMDGDLILINKLFYICNILDNLEKTDKHPVSRQAVSRKKILTKSWKREDLVSIVYLNALPYEKKESQGGSHRSPRYHQRRGFNRIMKSDRYKNNKNFMKPVWVKPTWVGVKSDIINGVTYKVLKNVKT